MEKVIRAPGRCARREGIKPITGRSLRLPSIALLLGALAGAQACGDDPAKSPVSTGGGEAGDASRAGGGEAGDTSSAGGSLSMGASSAQGGAGAGATATAGTSTGGAGEGAGVAGGSGGAGMADGLSFEQFCELRTRARQWLRECRSFGDASGWWGTQNIEQVCSSGRDAVDAGRLVYDPIAAEACAALSVGDCDDIEAFAFGFSGGMAGFLQGSACEGVLTGTVALDGACQSDSTHYASECANGFCSKDACPGTCVPYSAAGKACDGITTACDPATSFCNPNKKCQAYAPRGQACSGVLPCSPDDRCHIPPNSGGGTCVEVVKLGETCDDALDQCAKGSVCYAQKCVDQVPLNAKCTTNQMCPADAVCGGTCLQALPLEADCTPSDTCILGSACVAGKCRLLGTANQACPCDVGLWCDVDNTCQPPGDVGDDCEQATGTGSLSTCQVPLFCDPATNTCQTPAAEGEGCNYAYPLDSCQAGFYCVCSSGCAAPISAVATCQRQRDLDEDCTLSRECLSGACTETKCAEPAQCR